MLTMIIDKRVEAEGQPPLDVRFDSIHFFFFSHKVAYDVGTKIAKEKGVPVVVFN